ncbi:MAG: DedA family protein, partial [Sulfuricurvum sp.]
MDDMLNNLSTYGYAILFLYSLGGGMVALIGAGVLSFMGKMDLT